MNASNKGGQPPTADDAWASLDESDDWRDRSLGEPSGSDRPQRTATNVRVSTREGGALRATNGPHLVVVAGAEVGRIYPLADKVLKVGRGEDNQILLSDASVSREHARLESRQGSWWVVDLHSANGTFVQARRVQSSALVPGEQVAFGHVRLQFRQARIQAGEASAAAAAPAAAPLPAGGRRGAGAAGGPSSRAPQTPQAPGSARAPAAPAAGAAPSAPAAAARTAASGGRRALRSLGTKRVATGCGLLVALGLGWSVYRAHGQGSAAFVHCQAAAKAFAAYDLDATERALVQAVAAAPKHPRVVAWRRALRAARQEVETLGQAKEALSGGQLARARALLAEAQGGSLVARREGLLGELDRAEKAALMEAQTAHEAGLVAEVAAIVERMGGSGDGSVPARADVAALARWGTLRGATAQLYEQASRWRAKPHAKPNPWTEAAGQSRALRAALATFRRARATGAARLALRALGHGSGQQEQQFAGAMQRFDGLWDAGMEEYRGKRAFAAIRVLTEAKQLAAQVGGSHTAPVRDIDGKLADMYYVVGMQALAGHKLPEAAEALRVALGLSPQHALSARRLGELEDRMARMLERAEFFVEGRGGHDKVRARELLRQVVATMPQSTQAGARARTLLRQLGG